MPGSRLLAQLTATKFSGEAENIATESLAYLASAYPAAARGLIRRCREVLPELPPIETYSTQDRSSDDAGIPDLVGRCENGTKPLLLEAKFWAGLTENQPITYLRRLDPGSPGLLLVVAPARRISSLWMKLTERTGDEFVGTYDGDNHVARFGRIAMAVVSWDAVTSAMKTELEVDRDHDGLSDLGQLTGLCEYQEQAEMLPFSSEELTGGIGRRIRDLETLIGLIAQGLVPRYADITGLNWSASSDYVGRYLRVRGWDALLHINFRRWADEYPTPLWLEITDKTAPSNPELLTALEPLRRRTPPRVFEDGNKIQMPIELFPGAEREELVEKATEQVIAIHDLLPDGPRLLPTT